jgi:ubiquinone/menaquinone biosynthesis C-methylase UbiE
MTKLDNVTVNEVRRFWERHPLAAAAIPAAPGTREFYEHFARLREDIEPPAFQEWYYAYATYRGKRVLDVGCGNGYLLSHFARAGAETTGVDLTTRGVALSAERFRLEGLPGRFVQANAEQLPFVDGQFDLVLSMGVLHHTPKTEAAVAEIRRVLRPGGRLLVMLYHRNSLVYRFLFPLVRRLKPSVRGKSQEEMVNRVDGIENPLGKVYSKAQMRQLLDGFGDIEVLAQCVEPAHFGREWIGRLVPALVRGWLGPYVGWFLYARAIKGAQSPRGSSPTA